MTSRGAVAVPTDPQATERELSGLLEQVRPRLVVTDRPTRARVGDALSGDREVVEVEDLVGDWTRPTTVDGWAPADLDGDDLAVLLPTSGTTGRSKLVMQTHRAYAMAGEGFPYWMQLTSDDRMMTSLPFFHVNALAYSSLGSLAAGAQLAHVRIDRGVTVRCRLKHDVFFARNTPGPARQAREARLYKGVGG